MMTSFATLTIGQAPRSDIMPLLMEYLPEESVTHVGLLDGLTSEQIEQRFSPEEGEPAAGFTSVRRHAGDARLVAR
ncbi:hypothetical protein ACVWWM_000831 [Ewingella americana]